MLRLEVRGVKMNELVGTECISVCVVLVPVYYKSTTLDVFMYSAVWSWCILHVYKACEGHSTLIPYTWNWHSEI